jgi:porin
MKTKNLLTTYIFGALALTAAAAPIQFSSPFAPTPPAARTNQTVSSMPEGLTNEPDAFWRRDTLLGDFGGLRDEMNDAGFGITPVYEAEVFGSLGKGHDGVISDGLFDVALDLDLERITHFWKDAAFHLNVLDIYGPSLSSKYVGDFSNTSNLAGYNSFRLQEIWLQQNFWDKRISLRAGVLAADTEFFSSQASSLFLNGTLGAFTLLVTNFPDAPAYPVAAPGIRLDAAPVSMLDFKAAVFWPNADANPAGNNSHGTDFDIRDEDGALLAFEGSFLVNQSPNDLGLIGSYRLGTFIQHGDYTTWQSQAAFALGTGGLSRHGTNFMVYGVADQELFKNGQYTVEAFARVGFAPSRYSFVDNYFDAGFNFIGFIPNRDADVAGIAVARSGISGDFSDSQVLQGNPRSTSETVIEATYKIQVAKWGSIQPDLQYVFNPSGVRGSKNAFVLGVRTTIAF